VTPESLARRLFERLGDHDAAGAFELFAPAAPIEILPARIVGTAASEGRAFLASLVAAFPDLLIHVRSVLGTPQLAVVEVKLEGTQAADFQGVLNQEKHLDVDQAWLVWAADDRITRFRVYGCQNQLYRRLAVKRLDRVSILG
jgi:ketosteroid isomerase-like protein